MRISDAQSEFNRTIKLGNVNTQYMDTYRVPLDLYNYAKEKGYNPPSTDQDNTSEAAIAWLQQQGLYEQAQAQAGMVNHAKSLGYESDNYYEAYQFEKSWDTQYNNIVGSGGTVEPGATLQDMQSYQPGQTVTAGQSTTPGATGGSQTGGTTPEQAGGQASAAGQQTDAEFQQWMNSQNLSADQKAALQAVYDWISANDIAKAQQVTEAMAAATKYSDPYFKAQISLVTDALSRGLESQEGDLDFRMTQLQNSLQALQDNIGASKDHSSFQHQQELQGLARKYTVDMEATANQMAATGFTSSSRRARTEELIGDVNEGAVESANRQLAYQTGNLNRQLASTQQDTQLQVQNLQRLAAEGKLDLLRGAEEQVGTNNLAQLGYTGLLGQQGPAIGGQIPRQQTQDALSFAGSSGFVF